MAERGKYFVIEGADATGKSEQAIRLSSRLQKVGRRVLLVHNDDTDAPEPIQEPGGVPTANALRRIIKNAKLERDAWTNVMLFTAARRLNWLQAMKPALDDGIDVVSARSWISTVAYQGYGEGVDVDAIAQRTLVDVGQEYMSPDLELILTLRDESVRKSLIESRGQLANPDTFESMPDTFQGKMKDGYELFAQDNDIEVLPVEIKLDQTPEEIEASKRAIANTIWERAKEHLTQQS